MTGAPEPALPGAPRHRAFEADVDDAVRDRCSPAGCTGIREQTTAGAPDAEHAGTGDGEHQNLTVRMSLCRSARPTEASSEEVESRRAPTPGAMSTSETAARVGMPW